jgi:hypothetical protein
MYNSGMRWRIFAGIGSIILALGLLAVSLLVPGSVTQEARVITAGGVEGVLRVEYPRSGWAGDWQSASASLTTVGSDTAGDLITIRARLESPEDVIEPEGEFTSNILPGGTASFSWRMRTLAAGESRSVIWVYASEEGSEEQLLFAREFTYSSLNYGFLSPNAARSLMAVFALAGLLLLLMPNFKEAPEAAHKE